MIDQYHAEHQETGSSNISQASPEWRKVLDEAERIQADSRPNDYVVHVAYELVNQQVATGVAWNKCSECGSPYRLDSEASSSSHCSPSCFESETSQLFLEGEGF